MSGEKVWKFEFFKAVKLLRTKNCWKTFRMHAFVTDYTSIHILPFFYTQIYLYLFKKASLKEIIIQKLFEVEKKIPNWNSN